MDSAVNFNHVSRALKIATENFSLRKLVNGKQKLNKLWLAYLFSHVSMIIVMLSNLKQKLSDPNYGLAARTEDVVVFLGFNRSVIYMTSAMLRNSRLQALRADIFTDRQSYKENDDLWQLTLDYCRKEFFAIVGFVSLTWLAILMNFASVIFFQMNEYRLPIKVYILWLPFDGVSFNWLLNYFYQVWVAFLAGCVLTTYIPMVMFLVNHSCWGLDVLITLTEKLRSTSEEMDLKEALIDKSVTEQLKKLVKTSYTFMERHAEIQDLLEFNFLVEFSVLSTIFCCCLYTVSDDFDSTVIVYLAIEMMVSQLFIYCWLGERVIFRIEKLTAALYDVPWYKMKVGHRKDILKILLMAQNMKGFNGIFHEVNMETFQTIMDFAYSLYTLLQSTK